MIFRAICPAGLEELLAQEIAAAGATKVWPARGGVDFEGDREAAMRACLTSRLANRILLKLGVSEYYGEEDVYNFACRTKWEEHFGVDDAIRIDVTAARCPLRSLEFVTLRIKDGICDRFEHFQGARPSVDKHRPVARVFAHLTDRRCTFYLDLCGEPLFKRGWRMDKGEAPLKENLAAGLLMLAGWTPETPLADLFCGSGTIPIEAAAMACGIAPGLRRKFAFERLKGFDKEVWQEILEDARAQVNPHARCLIRASDISTIVVGKAIENARAAGLEALLASGALSFTAGDARKAVAPAPSGLIVSNPPYGEQSNPKSASVASMVKDVSDNLKRSFPGWQAWMLTSDLKLPRQMRLSESRKVPLFNGPLECRFFRFDLVAGSFRKKAAEEPQPEPQP